MGFGGWEVGGDWGACPEEAALHRALHAGFDAGINWVDTAEAYGEGRSEEILGRALQGRPDVLVATKFAPSARVGPMDVRRACEASLRRLGRDRIDLYQLHFPCANLQETWEAMARLVDDGLVRHIGVSNFEARHIAFCERTRHVDSYQPQFSLVWQEGREELIPACAESEIGVITYGSLAYGLLTGTVDEQTEFSVDDWRSGEVSGALRLLYEALFAPGPRRKHLAVARAVAPIAAALRVDLAGLAIAWVVHQAGVTSAIVGTRSARHAEQNARAAEIILSADVLAEIDRCVAAALVTVR